MFGVCSPALHRFSISFSQNSTTQINSNRWNKEQLDLLLIQYYPRVNSNKCPNTSTDRLTMRAGRQMQPLYRRLNHCVCDARVTYRRIAERFGCRKRVRLCGHVVCVGPLRYAVAETAVAVPKPHDPVTRSLSASEYIRVSVVICHKLLRWRRFVFGRGPTELEQNYSYFLLILKNQFWFISAFQKFHFLRCKVVCQWHEERSAPLTIFSLRYTTRRRCGLWGYSTMRRLVMWVARLCFFFIVFILIGLFVVMTMVSVDDALPTPQPVTRYSSVWRCKNTDINNQVIVVCTTIVATESH